MKFNFASFLLRAFERAMLLGRDLYRALLREAASLPDQNSR